MSMFLRSLKNLIRSPLRSILMVVLLAVSIGLALIMATVHAATQTELGDIGGVIGTEIAIRSAGSFGGMGGGEPLAQEDVDKLSDIEHVASVQASVQTRYTGDSLEAPDAGSIGTPPGDRPGRDSSSGASAPPSGGGFSMGITVMGISSATESPTLMGASTFEIVEGSYLTSDNADEMVVGQELADTNSLTVGSTVDIEGTELTVVGIYDSGTVFANNMIVMPIETAERVFELDGVTSVTVLADEADNVDAVVASIREVFDEDTADVTTAEDQYERISGNVSSTQSTATIAMIVAFVVAGVVVLFSVILMIRQRVKEIGIMKAIGASNWRIGLQFSLETLAVSVVGAIIGALITYPLAQKVADLMAGTDSTGAGGFPGGGYGGPAGMFAEVGGRIGGLDVAVSPTVFLYALAIAAGLAILASVLPAWYIARVRPAEVLRNE
jgi:putative ABC transport system permease protein